MSIDRIRRQSLTFDEKRLLQEFDRQVRVNGLFSPEANKARQQLGQMIDKRLDFVAQCARVSGGSVANAG